MKGTMYREWQIRLLVLLVKAMVESNHSYDVSYESGDIIVTDEASDFTYKIMECEIGNVIVIHDDKVVKSVTNSVEFNNDSNAIAWNCLFKIRDAEDFYNNYIKAVA